MDMNDRALRRMVIGLGGASEGVPRESGFDITAASEVMAILCLCSGRSDLKDRLGRILVGFSPDKTPVWASDLKAPGAMAALLKDAVLPNLVQTLEGNPALVHGGPFANIAQGTNTLLATRLGLSLSDYVVTEAGFGADLGAEKFLNIKCRAGGLQPAAVVVVATVRALRYHGGQSLKQIGQPDPEALQKGLPNLEKHLENIRAFGLEPVVAINRFTTDTDEELELIASRCRELGVSVSPIDVWGKGGAGAEELARLVAQTAENAAGNFRLLYKSDQPIETKIEKIARTVYGAEGVDYQQQAQSDLQTIDRLGLQSLSVCMAKTQKSLSDDEKRIGRPSGFRITVRQIEIASGAGFVVPITGSIMRMPGLPATPAAEAIDIDDSGQINGLF
jgi:formate--tetrahydrofolate ligase